MGRGMAGAHRLRLVTRGGLRPGGGARRSRPLQLRGQVALLGDAQLGAGSLRWLVALRPVGPTASLALTAQSLSYALTYRASGRGGDLELGMRQRHLRLVLGARVAVPTSMGGSPRPMRLILWGAAAPRAMGLRAQVDLWRHAQGQAGATPTLRLGGPLLGARAAQLWGHGALSWALPQNLLRAQGRLKLRRGRATVHLVAGADWPLGSDPRRRMRPRWGALGTIECFYEL